MSNPTPLTPNLADLARRIDELIRLASTHRHAAATLRDASKVELLELDHHAIALGLDALHALIAAELNRRSATTPEGAPR